MGCADEICFIFWCFGSNEAWKLFTAAPHHQEFYLQLVTIETNCFWCIVVIPLKYLWGLKIPANMHGVMHNWCSTFNMFSCSVIPFVILIKALYSNQLIPRAKLWIYFKVRTELFVELFNCTASNLNAEVIIGLQMSFNSYWIWVVFILQRHIAQIYPTRALVCHCTLCPEVWMLTPVHCPIATSIRWSSTQAVQHCAEDLVWALIAMKWESWCCLLSMDWTAEAMCRGWMAGLVLDGLGWTVQLISTVMQRLRATLAGTVSAGINEDLAA